ncbi:hypothetical protein FOA43_001355 [Brettanomyces nanus]|uniref:Uncharacterized protein n=1 Tax=Eeniella nana TaxID=13502 RepID=A0A875RY38_EENNA|nr:uncharacterized protein FOA43_001355 [Brettanomyces nanus]QPG74036.1 hypothetical protein FOA43_001355 [Brettanomyces nanus]
MEAVRVDAKYIEKFGGKTVKVIGKLKEYNGDVGNGVVEANGNINLKFQTHSEPLVKEKYYEFVATVDPGDHSLKVIETVDMGDDLNQRALDKMVSLCHKFPDLFYDKSLAQ